MRICSKFHFQLSVRTDINEKVNCALVGYYLPSSSNLLPAFRDKQSFPSSGFKNH